VTWAGDLPRVPPFRVWPDGSLDDPDRAKQDEPNPNAPAIDPTGRGVANAVVFLRGLDPDRARPWDHLPARVEQRGRRFHVLQGEADGHLGFVRRGDPVEMVSRDKVFHSLHAGGAAFFTLPFPNPGQPRSRALVEKGIVELTSAAGYYWMRAYLFVDDHPYYTRTDSQGRFTLSQVPPGRYELVCWLPNWAEERHDRDPETALITRLHFRRPVERLKPMTLGPRATSEASFTFTPEDVSEVKGQEGSR
jgi:hypothetical protein